MRSVYPAPQIKDEKKGKDNSTKPKSLCLNSAIVSGRSTHGIVIFCDMLDTLLRGEQTRNTSLLVLTKPRFTGLSQSSLTEVVNELAHDDQNKSDGVHPVNTVMENLNTNADTPEVHGKHRDVEEGSRRQTEEKRGKTVEESQTQGEADEVTADLAVPSRGVIVATLEDGGLNTVDNAGVERELTQHLVYGTFANKVLLGSIGQTIEGSTQQSKEITLQLISAGDITAVGTRNMIGSDQYTHTADTDDNTSDLGDMVSYLQEEERDDDHNNNGPEVDQLRAQHSGILVCQHNKVVAFYITESKDDVYWKRKY